jgi:NAD(P)-dependent dehydrogenase (short-subunit alcohol dehydrogenase family)
VTFNIDLGGKRALVTGAGQGVGRGIAMTLAAAGAEVLVNDLVEERAASVVDELAAAGGRGVTAVFDVTDYDAVRGAIDDKGPIDILVNNAGNAGQPVMDFDITALVQTEPSDWEPFIRVNFYGVMYGVRAALPGMIERGWGRIVTVISDAGRIGEPHLAAYSAAKAAAAGFCRSVAKEVGRYGITVNCVSLGTMQTPGTEGEDKARQAESLKRYIIRRRGLPEDVAAMVTFLASPLAPWVTGQTIPVNGGYSLAV